MLIKSMGGGLGSDDTDGVRQGMLDALEILVENLRKECYAKFADRDDYNQTKKSCDDLQKRMQELENRMNN